MARAKQFDPDTALDKALEVFWACGYENTSVQDLVDVMNVNRGSLYDTFGGKHQLYLAAIDRYLATRSLRDVRKADPDRPVRQVLSDLFERFVAEAEDPGGAQGCMLTNSICELAARDPMVAERTGRAIAGMEDVLSELICRGQERGEIAGDRDPRALARYLINAMQGLRVLSKVYRKREPLAEIAEQTLSILDRPA